MNVIIGKLAAKITLLMRNHPNAKAFSKRALSKLKTKKVPAFIFLFFGMSLFEPNKQHSPDDLRRKIATNLDSDDGMGKFDSNRLSEILRSLKDNKLLSETKNLKNKKHRRPKTPGPHPEYELSSEAKKIVILLNKPEAVKTILGSLKGLLVEYLKYILMITLYMIRDGNKQQLEKCFWMVRRDNVSQSDLSDRIDLFQARLALLNDKSLENEAKNSASNLLPYMTEYVNTLSLIFSLSELKIDELMNSKLE